MNTPITSFNFSFVDDGSSSTVEIDAVTGPITFGGTTNPKFDVRTASDVTGLSTYPANGIAVAKVSFVHGVLVLSLTGGTRTAGQQLSMQGSFVF